MVKLKKIPVPHLSEIFQSLDIKFAFVNAEYSQVSVPAKCRDFLGDCLWSRHQERSVSIYGFNYDYRTDPYDTKVLRISLTFPDLDSIANFTHNFDMLEEKEIKAGIKKPSKYIEVEEDPLTLVIEASKHWQSAIWKLSLYTFYLKLLAYPKNSLLLEPEKDYYITLSVDGVEDKMLAKVNKKKANLYPSLYDSHNKAGFISAIKSNGLDNKYIFGRAK